MGDMGATFAYFVTLTSRPWPLQAIKAQQMNRKRDTDFFTKVQSASARNATV